MCVITLFTSMFLCPFCLLPISFMVCFKCLLEYETGAEVSKIQISQLFQENSVKRDILAGKVYKKSHLDKYWAELTAKPTPRSVNWKTNLKKTWLLLPELMNLPPKPGEGERCNSCISAARQRKARQLIWLTLKEVVLMKLSFFLDLHQTAVWELRQPGSNTGAERMQKQESWPGL